MPAWVDRANRKFCLLLVIWLGGSSMACRLLEPKPIQRVRNNLPAELIADNEPQFERGRKRPLIDGFGWGWGIPSKIMLWDRRAENHRISDETEMIMADYLAANELSEVKVRLNQYRPLDDWRRLVKKQIGGLAMALYLRYLRYFE